MASLPTELPALAMASATAHHLPEMIVAGAPHMEHSSLGSLAAAALMSLACRSSSFPQGTGEMQKSPARVSISAGHAPSHLPRPGDLSKGLRSPVGPFFTGLGIQRPGPVAAYLEGRRRRLWEAERWCWGWGGVGQGLREGCGRQQSLRCLAAVMRGAPRALTGNGVPGVCLGGESCVRMELRERGS